MLTLKRLTSNMLYNNKSSKFSNLIVLFFFLFFFSFYSSLKAKQINDFYKDNFCNKVDPKNLFNQKIPTEIIIETNNPKKWSKNIFSLLVEFNSEKFKTDDTDWYTFQIDRKYKKKFKSNIKFIFKDPDYDCSSKGRINIRGDLWWHLDWKNGHPFSSIKVGLKNGHLNNLVAFNLLLPRSRESSNIDINLELFVTSLFNKINLLAPKSQLIKVKINGHENTYLFQEVLSKEFLESRNLVEGPILEGDQSFTAEQFSNNKWRGDLALTKVINTSYALKSEVNTRLSFYAQSRLNNIFIDSGKKNKKQDRCNNNFLSINKNKYLKNKKEVRMNQIYESFIFATETVHGFTCDDRKFYFDPIQHIFLPIYNDGKSTLDITNNKISYEIKNSIVTKNAIEGSEEALKLLQNINEKFFFQELILNGFTLSFIEFQKVKKKIENNLIALKDNKIKENSVTHINYFEDIDPNYFGKQVKLIFINLDQDSLEICDFKLTNCKNDKIKKNRPMILKSLLSQNFTTLKKNKVLSFNKDQHYLFLSKIKNYSSNNQLKADKDIFLQKKINNNFFIEYNQSTKVLVDINKKKIQFILLNPTSRIKVQGDFIDSWQFEIDGSEYYKNKITKTDLVSTTKLTGCLTFLDINLKNVSLKSNYSLCEDAFNLIRVDGNIDRVEINNSFSDGLDMDFSDIKINSISVKNSLDDCLDMSFGNYKIVKAKFMNCGDKAVSAGEKSNVSILSLSVKGANIGVAAKDSSIVYSENSKIDSNICFASYRKKQEFSGSVLMYKDTNCVDDNFISQKGSSIKKK